MKQTKLIYILIGSRRRVGKDTFAKLLRDEIVARGHPALIQSFAGALKDEVTALLAIDPAFRHLTGWVESPEEKENIVRPLLIAWGNAKRYLNPNHWVDKVAEFGKHVQRVHSVDYAAGMERAKYAFVIVSDWRFPNEILRLRAPLEHRVIGIHLTRPGAVEGTPDEQVNDPLCRAQSNIQVDNDGDLTKFAATARDLVTWISKKLENNP